MVDISLTLIGFQDVVVFTLYHFPIQSHLTTASVLGLSILPGPKGPKTRPKTDLKNSDSIRNRPDPFTLLGSVVKDLRVLDPTRPESETRVGYSKIQNF